MHTIALYICITCLTVWFVIRPLSVFISGYFFKKKQKLPISSEVLQNTGISIVVPCHNESDNVRKTVESLLKQDTSFRIEIILVENNSTDDTFDVCKQLAQQYENIKIASIITPKGKSAISCAMNYGLSLAELPIILRLDADTILIDKDTIYNIAEPIIRGEAVATAGNVRIANSSKNILTKMQSIEYFFSMEVDRRSQQLINSVICASGAMQCFDRKILLELGGYHTHKGVSEDMDITLRMHQKGKVVMVENAVSFTDSPDKISTLYKQRTWWMMLGTVCLYVHKKGIGNIKYGKNGILGLIVLPIKVILTFQAFIGIGIKAVGSVSLLHSVDSSVLNWLIISNITHVILVWLIMIIVSPVARTRQGANYWYLIPIYCLIYQPLLAITRTFGTVLGIQVIGKSLFNGGIDLERMNADINFWNRDDITKVSI